MTSRFTDYEIRYVLNGEARRFQQRDTHMSDADALYYAALHSGIGLVYGGTNAAEHAAQLRRHVERRGLRDVQWRPLH
ncbi:DUF6555 family protein [Pseudomonas sp. CFBP 13710]|uniref:DUF6555 family protein n=1 Tax=Pseudomonas sp. CFBP 13710 TaxID=2775311 RepID=UPI001785C588|nr:DUF6555 family protein [Pseudomonas sp. CFBP 13710]MBD8729937.1 hypothetical protein [Pseudomonas sp. CFBP 13710]